MIKQERNESVARSIMRPVEISLNDARAYEDNPQWESYPKLNGVFARWDSSRKKFFSKRGIEFKEHLIPHLYSKYADQLDTLEGELWSPFRTLQQICGALSHERDEPAEHYNAIFFVAFDVPYQGGMWQERARRLKSITWPTILDVERELLNQENCDGKIFRLRNGIYQPGPSGNVLKVKFWKDCELTVIRPELGTPTSLYAGVLGALRCKFNDTEVSVGTGFSHEERIEFATNPPSRIKIKYLSLSQDGIPLNPSYIGLDI
jgi:ATP-dependent DNA ligase